MKLKPITPRQATKSFIKLRPLRSEMDTFKNNLTALLEGIDEKEHEENLKNLVRDFLLNTYYKDTNTINTKDRKDLVIHLGKTSKDNVGVIIEAKRPGNKNEMLTEANPNTKALHELVLYYMNERFGETENIDIKYCIATNIYEWFIIDSSFFERHFARDSTFYKAYIEWKKGEKAMNDNTMFYNNIVKPHIEKIKEEISVTYFDIRNYKKELLNVDKKDDKKLIELFRLLSPYYLLRQSVVDSNTLNDKFYKELLHIIGLEEQKDSGKVVINRKKEGARDAGSIIENALTILNRIDPLRRVNNPGQYGSNKEEQLFNIVVELSLTWINRILFLKLLEGQLINYHEGDISYRFMNIKHIHDFDELSELFHDVLAVNYSERDEEVKKRYTHIPYLNSSLFDVSELEQATIRIDALKNNVSITLPTDSVLRSRKIKTDSLPSLEYLLRFLDAYDFGSDSKEEDIQEDNKTLINASVLGKVFEKINGYKDGSIYTPSFITMYMCRQAIRPAIVQKFKEAYGWKVDTIDDLKNYIADYRTTKDILRFNDVVNSIHICDPAVGSGHFLVSALNELIVIKAELGIFADANGVRFPDFEITLGNDELIITDHEDKPVVYHVKNGKPINKEVQRLQCTLFYEKQKLIENCLFGVDINTNSVKICRLRLWIELLKNAYYREDTEYAHLETLPNIDINIKWGNSLVSRFKLDEDLSKALKSIKYSINDYRNLVNDYKNAQDKELKRGLLTIIDSIKNDFKTTIGRQSKEQKELDKARNELYEKYQAQHLFDQKLTAAQKKERTKLENVVEAKQKIIDDIKNNVVYYNAFEWRFEFPEVLNNNGDYEGFDVVIGNPPYIQLQKLPEDSKKALEQQGYETYVKSGDIYQLFYEKGIQIIKENGHLAYITSNKWMRTDYGRVSRDYLGNKCKVSIVIDFGMVQIFDSATTYTNILLLSKNAPSNSILMCRVTDDYNNTVLLEDYVDFAAVEIDNPKGNSWIAYQKEEYQLIKKIISQGIQLMNWNIQINYGIKTGCNDAFIITTEIKDQLIAEDIRSADVIKPILRGEDIKAYLPNWSNLWLINTHNGIKSSQTPSIDVERDYPAIYKWLSKFENQLKKRSDKGNHWSNLRNCAYLEDFYKPKIIYPNMTKFFPFVYDKHQFFTNDKSFIMTGDNLEYLTVFLNSSLFKFTFKDYFPELLGDTREVRKVFFETIPVKPVTNNEWFKTKLSILLEKKVNGFSIEDVQKELDTKIFDLYELTTAERSMILSSIGFEPISRELIKEISVSESS